MSKKVCLKYYCQFLILWMISPKILLIVVPSGQNCEIVDKFRRFLATEMRIRQMCMKKTLKIREIVKFVKFVKLVKLVKLGEYTSIKRKKHERKWTKTHGIA